MGDNQETAKKLVVNASCIGCGACTAIASEIFELNDEGMAVVKDGADLNSVNINDAIGACPVDAIHYES